MIERTALAVAVAASMAAAATLGVWALGFAIYALIAPLWGPAGAAALVALLAAIACAAAGLLAARRAQRARLEADRSLARAAEAEEARAAAAFEPAPGFALTAPDPTAMLGGLLRDRPMLAIGLALAAGVFAASRPDLARQAVSLLVPPRR